MAIKSSATSHFQQLLIVEPVFPEEMDMENLEDGLTDEDRRFLCDMPTGDEVRETVFSIESESATGPDRFGAFFYHTCWDFVSKDVFGAVTEFFRGVALPKSFTATTISLIPMNDCPASWSEYQPISLCNVTNKICTKLMTVRLGRVLPRVLSLSQSGFVPGRLLSDNVHLAQELIHSLESRQEDANVVFKLDMAKTYDRSEYGVAPRLSISVSGQMINNEKSSFIVGRQVSTLQIQSVQTVMGYRLKYLPVTYLGVPLYKGNKKACLFDPIISQIRSLLQGWAMTNLSHAGRLALIKSVLQATPLHLLQVILPPKSVLLSIERIFNGFFWGSYNGRRHIYWSSWEKVCFPVAEGQEDKIVWMGSSNWVFSTGAAWEIIRVASPRRQLLADIWHRSLRPTMSVFLWRLFNDRIPVDARMKKKGFSFPSKCQCCAVEEMILHLFVQSLAVQGVWQHFARFFGLSICETGDLTHLVHIWHCSTPFHSDLHIRTLVPFLILWFTWTQQNAAKYDGARFSAANIIFDVDRHLRTLPTVPLAPRVVRWTTPSLAWFKLNSDGSSLGNPGPVGAADIIRDAEGQVRLAYQDALGTATSVIAELTTLWRGLEMALAHSLAPIVVELQQMLGSDVQHIFREVNGAANHLAKEAASLQLTRILHRGTSKEHYEGFLDLIGCTSLIFAKDDDIA
ncbi:UNVERIFIED_CONTAM: hypothetical protein Sradi_0685000 [Sesamum radiatum]|uniref:Reverse transcriptase domain-containing protein n=1 Tax=Sesamum radiatum TaxID=300843 RepID=A0AAW2VR88_SESRA